MFRLLLILLLICVAIAYWKVALPLAILWVVFKAWSSKGQSRSPAKLQASQFKPPEAGHDPESIKLLNLGYRQFVESQDSDLIDLWPCQELTR
jgi:hypothetical protein